jgi:hypothetical protein
MENVPLCPLLPDTSKKRVIASEAKQSNYRNSSNEMDCFVGSASSQ